MTLASFRSDTILQKLNGTKELDLWRHFPWWTLKFMWALFLKALLVVDYMGLSQSMNNPINRAPKKGRTNRFLNTHVFFQEIWRSWYVGFWLCLSRGDFGLHRWSVRWFPGDRVGFGSASLPFHRYHGFGPLAGEKPTEDGYSRFCIYQYIYIYLVGGFHHFLFFHTLGIMIPTDFHIFQRGRYTTNQIYFMVTYDIMGRYGDIPNSFIWIWGFAWGQHLDWEISPTVMGIEWGQICPRILGKLRGWVLKFKLIFAYLCYDGDIPQGKLT